MPPDVGVKLWRSTARAVSTLGLLAVRQDSCKNSSGSAASLPAACDCFHGRPGCCSSCPLYQVIISLAIVSAPALLFAMALTASLLATARPAAGRLAARRAATAAARLRWFRSLGRWAARRRLIDHCMASTAATKSAKVGGTAQAGSLFLPCAHYPLQAGHFHAWPAAAAFHLGTGVAYFAKQHVRVIGL